MDNSIELLILNSPKANEKVYDYSEFENLPEFIRRREDAEGYLAYGTEMLEKYNGKFLSERNKEEIKDVLLNYFEIEVDMGMGRLEDVRIYIGEYKVIFLWFSLFKIRVCVDYD
jgi:hypothetical protein